MRSSRVKQIHRSVSAVLCVALIAVTVFVSPLNSKGRVQQAHAQLFGVGGPVYVMGGPGSAAALITSELSTKHLTVDVAAQIMAKMAVQSITDSIVTWINSGFQGSPAFVTDLKQYMLQTADAVAGTYIYDNPQLKFLCSPFQLDVQIALATSYQDQTRTGAPVQCTLSQVSNNMQGFLNGQFNQGGWASWMQVTMNPEQNTPTGAYLAAQSDMNARIAASQNQNNQELNWGNGFLSYKTCVNITTSDGTQQHCAIGTPGATIKKELDQALGAPQESLISAQEIDQIIGALFQQLAVQVLKGANGLLGLGGNSAYAAPYQGGPGSPSYLDQLNGTPNTQVDQDPIQSAISTTQQDMTLEQQVISQVNALQPQIDSANQYLNTAGCGDLVVSMPVELANAYNGASQQLTIDSSSLTLLQTLDAQYQAATTADAQQTALNQYISLVNNGLVPTQTDVSNVQSYVDYQMPNDVSSVQQSISNAENQCQNRTATN